MTEEREQLKAGIRAAFAATPPPEPSAIRGSSEGEEPYLLEAEFRRVPDLIADLDEELKQAGPTFHLWHGLDDENRNRPVNERRYGPWTWFKAISERFALFTEAEVLESWRTCDTSPHATRSLGQRSSKRSRTSGSFEPPTLGPSPMNDSP